MFKLAKKTQFALTEDSYLSVKEYYNNLLITHMEEKDRVVKSRLTYEIEKTAKWLKANNPFNLT